MPPTPPASAAPDAATDPVRARFGPLFDAAHYAAQLDAPVADPARHFIEAGDAAGLDPSPYFSTRFYKDCHPDWQATGAATALDDFLAHERAGCPRQPHPLIDPAAYLAAYPDLAAAGVAPTLHFAALGDREGRSPSTVFDAATYAASYLALDERQAFRHFVTRGRALGCQPAPVVRDVASSRAAAAAVLGGLRRPIVLCAHDAQPAGVPILTLDLADWFAGQGHDPVFVLLRGGPLVSEFRRKGPVFLLSEGWDSEGLATGLPPGVPVIVNSAAAADMATMAARSGRTTLLLVHEMRGHLDRMGQIGALVAARDAGASVIASFPRMAEALRPELGPLAIAQPGLLRRHLPLRAFREVRRTLTGGPVYIGAGHADPRKGFDLFLEAAQAIHDRQPAARFVWLGDMVPWARALADAALARGLPLDLPGFVADAPAWYARAAVYLLTSREDAGPGTVMQAAAVGTPFVGYAADIGLLGIADPLGRFVPPGQPVAFVAAALETAARDTQARRRWRRAQVRAMASFDRYGAELRDRLDQAARDGV